MPKISNSMIGKLKRLTKKAFRDAYVRATLEHGIAHQIRILRLAKKWSQHELAVRLGAKRQSTIARLEDPGYGRYSLATLLKLAKVFDVALTVKFISYGSLLADTQDLSPRALKPKSFAEEYPRLCKQVQRASSLISDFPPTPSSTVAKTISIGTTQGMVILSNQRLALPNVNKEATRWLQ